MFMPCRHTFDLESLQNSSQLHHHTYGLERPGPCRGAHKSVMGRLSSHIHLNFRNSKVESKLCSRSMPDDIITLLSAEAHKYVSCHHILHMEKHVRSNWRNISSHITVFRRQKHHKCITDLLNETSDYENVSH